MKWLAALWLRQAVVDQIDAGIAAVELPDHTVIYVPIGALPHAVREGDRVRLGERTTKNNGGLARRGRNDEP